MQRIQIRKASRPREDAEVPLPIDPRDPDVVRAKRPRARTVPSAVRTTAR